MRIYVREKNSKTSPTDPVSAFLNPPDQVVQPTKLHGCRYGYPPDQVVQPTKLHGCRYGVGRPSLTSLDSRFAHGDDVGPKFWSLLLTYIVCQGMSVAFRWPTSIVQKIGGPCWCKHVVP